MIYQRWNIKKPQQQTVAQMQSKLSLSALLCGVLASRGIDTPEKALETINDVAPFPSPYSFCDMQKLSERVRRAVDNGEKIVVFGDYDVDGVTATALMVLYLESIGADVYYKLPSRGEEGYGLSKKIVDGFAKKNVDLIFTVDNGISASEEIEYAASLGIDVVVTDHHLPPQQLPFAAVAAVDPLRIDDESGCKNLSGVGVAFMAACAIEQCECEDLLEYYADLVAIGTIADIMSLTGVNRRLVTAGLEILQQSDRPGLVALMKICGLEGKKITAENVAFAISPRLNAAGRMADATRALELILEEDYETAEEMARELDELNARRQNIERDIEKELCEKIDKSGELSKNPVLVVWGDNYHTGVIGIVASRLVEKYNKPAIVLSVDENGEARGSGRSFEGFSLYNAIASAEQVLERFGGHDLAAGLSVKVENLQAFSKKINDYAQKCGPIHRPDCNIDLSVRLCDISVDDIKQTEMLAPFGQGNPAPVYALENAQIEAVYPVSDGKHARIILSQCGQSIGAVIFGTPPERLAFKRGDRVDCAVWFSIYNSQAGEKLSAKIKAIRPAGLENAYMDYFEMYSGYCSGVAADEKTAKMLCPDRSIVVSVYREIGKGNVHTDDLRPMFLNMGSENTGKLLAAVDILKELGHILEVNSDGALLLVQNNDKTKKPLENSKILAALTDECGL